MGDHDYGHPYREADPQQPQLKKKLSTARLKYRRSSCSSRTTQQLGGRFILYGYCENLWWYQKWYTQSINDQNNEYSDDFRCQWYWKSHIKSKKCPWSTFQPVRMGWERDLHHFYGPRFKVDIEIWWNLDILVLKINICASKLIEWNPKLMNSNTATWQLGLVLYRYICLILVFITLW